MRALLGSLLLVGLLATPSFAQSAYDYPWCSVRTGRGGGAQSCYFSTYRQCMETISGIGGYCIRSPYYRGPRARRPD
jgi:Protein of unknown function (DUF3551)